jgi:predicted amidohydrolase
MPPNSCLRVAAVQMKFAPTIDENLAAIGQSITAAAKRRADAVLFPETAITGYGYDFETLKQPEVHDALVAVGRFAAKQKINVLIGTPVFRGRDLFNCLVVFDRRGQIVHCYAKCQLTREDTFYFAPGNAVALFPIDGVLSTAIICHERRYPELVRLGVMAGARIVFHPNAGMDSLAVSRKKRKGNDGIAIRAFENAIYYVFANSVGQQSGGKWSAGDSKIVAPDMRVLELADNEHEKIIVSDLDLTKATGIYAKQTFEHPRFITRHWNNMVDEVLKQAEQSTGRFDLPTPKR